MPAGRAEDAHSVEALFANAPTASDIALFEELAEWISEDDLRAIGGTDEPLWQTIRARPASFDVFRSFHGDEVRKQRLREIPYGEAIARVAERHGVDGLLIAAVVEAESSFKPCAVSIRGAIGLMQLMPATAGAEYVDPEAQQELCKPGLNLELGTRYLRHLLKRYGGDLELALAAYNAGPANVRRYGGIPPFRETRRYVEKVLSLYVDHHQRIWREDDMGAILSQPAGTPQFQTADFSATAAG